MSKFQRQTFQRLDRLTAIISDIDMPGGVPLNLVAELDNSYTVLMARATAEENAELKKEIERLANAVHYISRMAPWRARMRSADRARRAREEEILRAEVEESSRRSWEREEAVRRAREEAEAKADRPSPE
jgi:hypothetical protein